MKVISEIAVNSNRYVSTQLFRLSRVLNETCKYFNDKETYFLLNQRYMMCFNMFQVREYLHADLLTNLLAVIFTLVNIRRPGLPNSYIKTIGKIIQWVSNIESKFIQKLNILPLTWAIFFPISTTFSGVDSIDYCSHINLDHTSSIREIQGL